jgi:hypothetical protein
MEGLGTPYKKEIVEDVPNWLKQNKNPLSERYKPIDKYYTPIDYICLFFMWILEWFYKKLYEYVYSKND